MAQLVPLSPADQTALLDIHAAGGERELDIDTARRLADGGYAVVIGGNGHGPPAAGVARVRLTEAATAMARALLGE